MNSLLEGWSLSPETDDAALEAAEGSEELLELLATEVERKSRGIEDRNSFAPSTRRSKARGLDGLSRCCCRQQLLGLPGCINRLRVKGKLC